MNGSSKMITKWKKLLHGPKFSTFTSFSPEWVRKNIINLSKKEKKGNFHDWLFFQNSSTLTYDSILEIPINRNLLKTKSYFLANGAIGYKKYEFQPSRKNFWLIVILYLPKTIIFQGKSNKTCVFQHNMLS